MFDIFCVDSWPRKYVFIDKKLLSNITLLIRKVTSNASTTIFVKQLVLFSSNSHKQLHYRCSTWSMDPYYFIFKICKN